MQFDVGLGWQHLVKVQSDVCVVVQDLALEAQTLGCLWMQRSS